MAFVVYIFSDPPLEEEDIPAGLWLCHMCQMLQKQRTTNVSKVISNDDETSQHSIQKIKDSRPSTPITSDGVINAAKVRLSQKRSLSRVSSCSENSLSSDRDIKSKISRSNSEQYSNGAEAIESCEITPTNVNETEELKSTEEPKCTEESKCAEAVSSEESIPTTEKVINSQTFVEESDETAIIVESKANSPENNDTTQKEDSQEENTSNVESMDVEQEVKEVKESVNIEPDDSSEDAVQNSEDESVNLRTPLDELIRAASIMNPRQFELPRELNIFPQFPGDEKGNLTYFKIHE